MSQSLQRTQGIAAGSNSQRSRPSIARPNPKRVSTVVPHAIDPASAEVLAAMTAVAASAAAVLSLASIIRSANKFDQAPTVDIIQVQESTPVVTASTSVATASPTVAALASSTAEVEKVQSWISNWRAKTEATAAAAAAADPVPATIVAATSPTDLSKSVAAEVENVQSWISDWRSKTAAAAAAAAATEAAQTAPEAISMASTRGTVGTTRVTEPSMPMSASKADPAAAAAVLAAMSADAPVGTSVPSQAAPSQEEQKYEQEPMSDDRVLVGVASTPSAPTGTSEDDTAAAAREYEQRLSKVLSEAKVGTEPAATEAKRAQSVVTISDQYRAKIDALWTTYESKRVEETALMAKQEKLTMDLAALDEKQAATQEALRTHQMAAVTSAMRRVMEFLQSIWMMIMAFVERATGGRFGSSGSGSGAGASA